ncbi:hypothetical protein [Streptomyces sp. NPDC051677]|uniref:hypothetical protein n=1 Tax=Streptomyces sp. NPDC051677 TaxID=3365669 RepID=UPI0037D7B916
MTGHVLRVPRVVPLFVLAVVRGGLSFGVGSALVGRVMRVASHAPSLGGAFATVALNVGAFLGPLLAAATTGAADDYRGAAWVSAVPAAAATAITVTAASRARTRARAREQTL